MESITVIYDGGASIFRTRAGREHHGRAIPGRECVCHVVMFSERPPDS